MTTASARALPLLDDHATIASADLATALAKEQALTEWLRARASVVVGFSGGVDSTYLACLAVDTLGSARVIAIIGRSASYPAEQWRAAREVADRFAIPVREIDTDEMADPRYAANPTNRCYFCKSELWSRLAPIAEQLGMAVVVDGTNADDLQGHRPGAAAARERGVASPLADMGFTKAEIRLLSRERGIPTWDQPSSPCLSSRIPYGTAVTVERLRQVERAERALRDLGVRGDLRVRHHGELARIELAPAMLERVLHGDLARSLVPAVLDAGFDRVAVDLKGFRSGSLNASSAAPVVRGDALAAALAALGISGAVETRGRLGVIKSGGDEGRLVDAALREQLGALAALHGYTHLAVELPGGRPGARN